MAKGIWIFIEHHNGLIRKVSLELINQAKIIAEKTGDPVTAVVLGRDVSAVAEAAGTYGPDNVILVDDEKLEKYTTGAYTSVLNKLAKEKEPAAILLGNTAIGKDLAPRLAHRLGVGMASDCTGMEFDEKDFLKFKRPIYGGKAFCELTLTAKPVVATIRPNTFPSGAPDASLKPAVEKADAVIDADDLRAIVKEVVLAASLRPELIEADIIISGGRGMKGPENFAILEECADTIGAAVGASRAAVDAGWREQKFQVGQTGKTVSPTLYIACGISGAIQHLAGMGSSKVIVAINKDPDANIFTLADYGIVGDLFEIVPLLAEEFKKLGR
ncbi:electron transfer flavoprotein subunit alpha/FixB family protein [Bacillota bacterium]